MGGWWDRWVGWGGAGGRAEKVGVGQDEAQVQVCLPSHWGQMVMMIIVMMIVVVMMVMVMMVMAKIVATTANAAGDEAFSNAWQSV